MRTVAFFRSLSRTGRLAALLTLVSLPALAQVGIGTTTPDSKAALDIQNAANNRGLLVPRLTQAQRRAILNPPQGLLVFQTGTATVATDSVGFWYATGAATAAGVGKWLYLPDKSNGDNLGNHTATKNLNLGANLLVGQTSATDAVSTSGLHVDSDGKIQVGAVRTLQNDGSGIEEYRAGVEINSNAGLLSYGTHSGYSLMASMLGAGTRLMWLPAVSAFRAGYVNGTQWDGANIGQYSVAFGYNTRASGDYSAAFGNNCTAANLNTFAAGEGNIASGAGSVALGYYAHTNARQGAFVFADRSNFPNGTSSGNVNDFRAPANNTFNVRCIGGYNFYTALDLSVGVRIAAGGNAWTTVSDSTKKERVRLADGNAFLASIGRMRLGSWNYKGQSATTMRHYGPMAQDFYAAFGHDGVGTIGEPTSINQADFDGVNLIAIQALYRRVLTLEAENQALRAQAATTAQTVEARLRALEARPTAAPAGPPSASAALR